MTKQKLYSFIHLPSSPIASSTQPTAPNHPHAVAAAFSWWTRAPWWPSRTAACRHHHQHHLLHHLRRCRSSPTWRTAVPFPIAQKTAAAPCSCATPRRARALDGDVPWSRRRGARRPASPSSAPRPGRPWARWAGRKKKKCVKSDGYFDVLCTWLVQVKRWI